jgi:hypothetical protein
MPPYVQLIATSAFGALAGIARLAGLPLDHLKSTAKTGAMRRYESRSANGNGDIKLTPKTADG